MNRRIGSRHRIAARRLASLPARFGFERSCASLSLFSRLANGPRCFEKQPRPEEAAYRVTLLGPVMGGRGLDDLLVMPLDRGGRLRLAWSPNNGQTRFSVARPGASRIHSFGPILPLARLQPALVQKDTRPGFRVSGQTSGGFRTPSGDLVNAE